MNSQTVMILLAVLCAAVIGNALLLVFIIIPYRKVRQARGWTQTTGTVDSAEIIMRSDSEGGSSPYPHVVYSYRANGMALKNDHIQPGGDVGGMVAYKTLKKYPVGAQVSVFYDPANPSDALLERDVPGYVRWLWIALVFLNATICCCGVLPMVSGPLFSEGMKAGLPWLMQFISEQLKP